MRLKCIRTFDRFRGLYSDGCLAHLVSRRLVTWAAYRSAFDVLVS